MRHRPDTGRALDVWRRRDTLGLVGVAAWSTLFLWLAWLTYESGLWLAALVLLSIAVAAAYLSAGVLVLMTREWLSAKRSPR